MTIYDNVLFILIILYKVILRLILNSFIKKPLIEPQMYIESRLQRIKEIAQIQKVN